ncbi:MAG: MBL fold metallo-hydrolase [Endomicrobiales bacterium]
MNTPCLLEKIEVGALETNCYIYADPHTRKAFIIDPGADAEIIQEKITAKKFVPAAIINTHGHFDHIGANRALKSRFKVPLYLHRSEAEYPIDPVRNGSLLTGQPFTSPAADVLLEEGDTVEAGPLKLMVMHTPGHTPGGISLVGEGLIFTGDTLFLGSAGRWDLPGGDEHALMRSLKRFRMCHPATRIFPGHGPQTTLEDEFRHNPFLND